MIFNRAVLATAVATVVAMAGSLPVSAVAQDHQHGQVLATSAHKPISFGELNFDPLHNPPRSSDRYQVAANGKGLRFIQFEQAIRGEWLTDMRSAGVFPLQYYPNDTYLVWADDGAAGALRGWPQVRWQGDYLPEWKLEPGLAKREGLIANVGVHFFNDGDIDGVLAALVANGGQLVSDGPAQTDRLFHDAWIRIDASRLPALADLPQVVWLEYSSPAPILDDEMSSQIVARNYTDAGVPELGYLPWINALGYDGAGITWAVIDTGMDYTHPDFAGRIVGGVNYGTCPPGNGPGDDPASGGHGTHVGGIIGGTGAAGFADGQGFQYGIGMAPAVSFFTQNPICGVSGNPWPPSGGWQRLSQDALLGGALGGNGSWTSGEGGGTTYTAGARAWDQITRDGDFDTPLHEQFTMVFSAGNSGPGAGTLTAPKAAKNPIITGGTQNYRVSSNIDAIYNSSSRGPTQDGRFGVTIAAPAQQIASARRLLGASSCGSAIAGTDGHYAYCTGTSMAAPHAAGTAVIITDWWRDITGGDLPSPAMIKALLINGAKDYGGGGPIPNTTQGWGRIDVPGSLGLDFDYSEYIDQTEVFDSVGQVFEVTWGVPDTDKPLKVSLAWTDAAAAVGANPALVNDLDLVVETGGQTYLGNVFSAGMSVTGGSADTLNNQENVYVANPGDSVTIRIIASNLPGDGIPGNSSPTDQDFALACRNCVEQPGFSLAVTPASQSVCVPDDAEYSVEVGSVLGYDEPVDLSVSGQPTGTTATFGSTTVTPPASTDLVIGNTGAAAAGSYTLTITGDNADMSREINRSLHVATDSPATTVLQSPANNEHNVGYTPTLSWLDSSQAEDYRLQLATDAAFANIVLDTTVTDTSVNIVTPLDSSTDYYWRVQAANICGEGDWSASFRFRTQPAPGDCDADATPVTLFSEDFSDGLGDFTTTGSTGASTWALSTAQPGSPSGGNTVLAVNIGSISDQRLISPPVDLPANQLPLSLQFWNHQHMESSSSGCWDGGLLEISTDDGDTWTQFQDPDLLVRPYDGPISTGYNNPLGGSQGWCGDPRPWENQIVNLNDYAGETVRFRWRLGTDSTITRPGWHVDDILVRGCAGGEPPKGEADLSVTAAAVPEPALAGETLSYGIQVGNDGPDAATGVELTLELPAEVAFVAVAAGTPDWFCDHAGGVVSCELSGTLSANSAAADLVIDVQVAADAAGEIDAVASVVSQTDDPDPGNNEVAVTTLVLDPDEVIFIDGFECASGRPGCPD